MWLPRRWLCWAPDGGMCRLPGRKSLGARGLWFLRVGTPRIRHRVSYWRDCGRGLHRTEGRTGSGASSVQRSGVRGKILGRRRAFTCTPPHNAVVLCCDEKSQCQALERTQTGLPLGEGHIRTRTHDYYRHGTVTLFAALDYLSGKVLAHTANRHRRSEWLAFLKKIDASVARR